MAALVRPSAIGALVAHRVFTLVGFLVSRRPRLVHVDIPIARLPQVAARLLHRADQRRARRSDHPPRLRRALGRACE